MKKQTYTSMIRPDQGRAKSVPAPFTVYEEQLQVGDIRDVLSIGEFTRWDAMSAKRLELGLLYLLQLVNGVRVSELLKLHWRDSYMDVGFVVKGLKGSNSRLIIAPGYSRFMKSKKCSSQMVFSGFNYHNVYREYIKHGIGARIGQNVRSTITHQGRYQFVNRLVLMGYTPEQIKEIIGHKSIKSTLSYMGKE